MIISFLSIYFIFIMPARESVLESLVETQLKLKILYSSRDLSHPERGVLVESINPLERIFLGLLYSMSFKKVLSGRINNRIIINYFKKFSFYFIEKKCAYLEQNKNLFELEYLNTLALNSLYEISTMENND